MSKRSKIGYVSSQRVQKVLARAGVSSRRRCEQLIEQGEVKVNGVVIDLGTKVRINDEITVSGKAVLRRKTHITYMIHKPVGVVSTVKDDKGRPTVMDLVPYVRGLHPVGRLDADSEGLMLLSTDGDLTYSLTHPKHRTPKGYRVWTREGSLSSNGREKLLRGVKIDDGLAVADEVKILKGGCFITIHQGRNRQIRKMLTVIGYTVSRLVRERIGELALGKIAVGQFRILQADDMEAAGYTFEGS